MTKLTDELIALAQQHFSADQLEAGRLLLRAAAALEVYEKALRWYCSDYAHTMTECERTGMALGTPYDADTGMIARDALSSAASGGEAEP